MCATNGRPWVGDASAVKMGFGMHVGWAVEAHQFSED